MPNSMPICKLKEFYSSYNSDVDKRQNILTTYKHFLFLCVTSMVCLLITFFSTNFSTHNN